MKLKLRSTLVLLAALGISIGATGCSRKSDRITKVTVAGEAVTKVEPDTAVVVMSVVTQSAQALDAQQQNARKSEAVAAAVKSSGGTNAEIKTSDYTLTPQYDYRDNKLPKIIGYDARNSIIVTTTDLKNVGAVIDAASKAGVNSIQNISFMLKQTSPARGQALADATQQAMNKAQSIAQALGGRVRRVVEESESATVANDGINSYERSAGLADLRAATVTPVMSGHLTVRSNVQLIVEIES